jgi:GT2 family glycosyltransferase
VQPGLIRVYNSGAVLRMSALREIGGFPEEYWLDYLDHAVFHRLQAAGGKVFVMEARLAHEMSIHQPNKEANPAHAARQANQLAAEVRFYREHGTAQEQRRHRMHPFSEGGVQRGLGGESRFAAAMSQRYQSIARLPRKVLK